MKSKFEAESGFIVLIGMLILILGAGVWFGTVTNMRTEDMRSGMQSGHIDELQKIKNRMLTYAVMQPEIFNDTVSPQDIPGLGYFPCPDTNGDGNTNNPCGGVGVNVVIGMVPESISSRMFNFIEKQSESHQYWYAVDARFLVQNTLYAYDAEFRRFPLNANLPALANLTLDGRNDIVMVLFYSGQEMINQNQSNIGMVGDFLEFENADGDVDFISVDPNPGNLNDFNDSAIAITREEWRTAMLSRASSDAFNNNDLRNGIVPPSGPDQIPDLCETVPQNAQHWFNECTYIGGIPPFPCTNIGTGPENLVGQNWRGFFGCPP